ncbi:MAG: NPCBM/NEW2 domain-containing protein [bacterium]
MELELRRRNDPQGETTITTETIPTEKIGIVLVDTWDYHWCMTCTERYGSFVPRFNKALEGFRKLGIPVFWGPTDVSDHYVGTPMRERALAVPSHELPKLLDLELPELPENSPPCMCGPGVGCPYNHGFQAMAPGLNIPPEDLIVEGRQELYSWCQELGLTHLLYMGFATNACMIGKMVGLNPMRRTGIKTLIARDMTDGWTTYDPATGLNSDIGTDNLIAALETYVPTIHAIDELRKIGLWEDEWVVDPVRMAPWGKPTRPYLFEKGFILTLTAPLTEGVDIYYTLDGTEPGLSSKLYTGPLKIEDTCTVRTVAFRNGKQACLESSGYFARLPEMPSMPDVHISDLKALRETVSGFNLWANVGPEYVFFRKPTRDKSYAEKDRDIVMRQKTYAKGLGVEAPSMMLYELKPEYDRFVGIGGMDETMSDDELAGGKAFFPMVSFKVFIDGNLMAESPWLRFTQEPWRFDIKIPKGSRVINIITTEGEGSRYNFAYWANAGFVLKK